MIRERGRIESCQVNSLSGPFNETEYPDLLMQDLSIVGMFAGPDFDRFGKPTGVEVRDLSDWHRVIDWCLIAMASMQSLRNRRTPYARNIDYAQVEAEEVSDTFSQGAATRPDRDGREEKSRRPPVLVCGR